MRTLLASSSPSFDLASEETVESLVNTSVENAVEDGAITEANKPSSAATAAVAKLIRGGDGLEDDIDAASTPEAMMASAASVSAVMQGSEVKTAVADAEGGGGACRECARHADRTGRRVDDERESRDGEEDGVGRLAEGSAAAADAEPAAKENHSPSPCAEKGGQLGHDGRHRCRRRRRCRHILHLVLCFIHEVPQEEQGRGNA